MPGEAPQAFVCETVVPEGLCYSPENKKADHQFSVKVAEILSGSNKLIRYHLN